MSTGIAEFHPVPAASDRSNSAARRISSEPEAIAVAQQLASQFAEGASERDRHRILPHFELDAFSQSGLWAISVPQTYDGLGASTVTITEVFKTISAADSSLGQIPHNHFCVVDAIRLDGTEQQKRFYFNEVLNGKRFGNAFSEAGTKNVMDFQTKIRPDGDEFVVDGRKFYSTGALFAHWIPIAAVDEEKHGQLCIVPRNSPGITVIDDWSSFGQRTTASGTVVAEGLRVRPEWIIPAYRGFERPTFTGPLSQIIQAAIDAGIARAAVEETIRFVRTKSRPWIDSNVERASDDPLTISQVGSLEFQLHTAEALLERAARTLDLGSETPTEEEVAEAAVAVAEAKIATTEAAILSTNKLFELAGTQSTLAKYQLDRLWRNARTHTLHDPVRWKYHAIGNYYLNNVLPPRHPWN
jgi:SfnB family sulfur acquisition oxidoreductase